VYAIRFRRFRSLLLVAPGSRRRSLLPRQLNGRPGSRGGRDVLTATDGEIGEKSARRHPPRERLLLHDVRDLGRRGQRLHRFRLWGGDR
jgi:hypothetical protein